MTYMDRMIWKVIEIGLYLNNMKEEDGLCLSQSWKLLIHTLRGHRKHRVQYYQSLLGH
jgi:hypothetical protein